MIKEGKFGVQEAVSLTVIAIVSKVFFSSPAILAGLVGNTGWYMTFISAAVALIGFGFIYLLLKRFPGKDLAEIFEISFGRVGGFAASGLLGFYMFFTTITRTNEMTEFLKVYVMPLSPNWFVAGIFVACVFMLCMLGLESMARVSKLFIYFLVFGFAAVLAMGVQNYDVNNLFPILGQGLDKVAFHGVIRSSIYGEVIILAIFAKSLHGVKYIKKEGIRAILISVVIISAGLLACSLTFPNYIQQEITSPMYEMATLIDYGRFIQRVESIFLYVWVIGEFISASIMFYSFIRLFCHSFRITDKKPIVIGSCITLYALALMHKDIITIIAGYVAVIRGLGSLPMLTLPLIALIVASIRKKGGDVQCAK